MQLQLASYHIVPNWNHIGETPVHKVWRPLSSRLSAEPWKVPALSTWNVCCVVQIVVLQRSGTSPLCHHGSIDYAGLPCGCGRLKDNPVATWWQVMDTAANQALEYLAPGRFYFPSLEVWRVRVPEKISRVNTTYVPRAWMFPRWFFFLLNCVGNII